MTMVWNSGLRWTGNNPASEYAENQADSGEEILCNCLPFALYYTRDY